MTVRKRLFITASGFLLLILIGAALALPPVWRLKKPPVHQVQWRKNGRIDAQVGPGSPSWVSLSWTSKHVIHAVIVSEDARYFQHNGFDFHEIIESLKINIKHGRYVRGGSTISQQVVKLAFLSNEKTILRKFREALGTIALEHLLTKKEILEWYLNLAEFGDHVYGIKEAAQHYFRTKPELVTVQQAANLALVLPSPNGWSVGLRRKRLTSFGHKRFATIISKMLVDGYITENLSLGAMSTGDFGRPIKTESKRQDDKMD